MYLFVHKPDWKSDYAYESESVISSYGGELELHHIGSTAIAGREYSSKNQRKAHLHIF